MSGGAWEYMASHVDGVYGSSGFDATSIASYNNKYFDIYLSDSTIVSYNNKILGDATGEMGPFYGYTDSDNRTKRISLWYSDLSHFIDPYYSWFSRGGYYGYQDIAGIFHFDRYTGEAYGNSFRLVLS